MHVAASLTKAGIQSGTTARDRYRPRTQVRSEHATSGGVVDNSVRTSVRLVDPQGLQMERRVGIEIFVAG